MKELAKRAFDAAGEHVERSGYPLSGRGLDVVFEEWWSKQPECKSTGTVSDGYHPFDELYDHRITLFIALCHYVDALDDIMSAWRSKFHSDGSAIDGWFVMGIGRAKGVQMTYHLPLERWTETDFVTELERAPEFDGHTSADVVDRLKKLYR